MNDQTFEVHTILERLRQECGISEFGFRVQALFAHALISIGASILECRQQGHPDIIADTGIEKWKFEVTVIGQIPYKIDIEDLKSLRPCQSGCLGFLALLDSGPPICWLILPHNILGKEIYKALHIMQIRRLADSRLSLICTDHFASLVIRNQYRIENLSFGLLRQWALEGRCI